MISARRDQVLSQRKPHILARRSAADRGRDDSAKGFPKRGEAEREMGHETIDGRARKDDFGSEERGIEGKERQASG
jgi:hypothetical protein